MHVHPAWAFGVILATELWATGHLLGRDAYRGSSRRCDGHWSGNRRGVTVFHSFTRSLTLSTPSATPSDTPTRETFQPIVTASPHTLKPLTSNQPWRPNGVLYGRHWANAACTRASTPSPPFHIPSVPAAIWLTPHQHPSSPTHISQHNRHAYAQAHTFRLCTGVPMCSDKGLIDSFVMSLKQQPPWVICHDHT